MSNSEVLELPNSLSSLGGSLFAMSPWAIIASVVFSMLGIFYFKRGKSQSDIPMIVCGVLLLLYPYFVSNALYIVLIGAGLLAAPHFVNRM